MAFNLTDNQVCGLFYDKNNNFLTELCFVKELIEKYIDSSSNSNNNSSNNKIRLYDKKITNDKLILTTNKENGNGILDSVIRNDNVTSIDISNLLAYDENNDESKKIITLFIPEDSQINDTNNIDDSCAKFNKKLKCVDSIKKDDFDIYDYGASILLYANTVTTLSNNSNNNYGNFFKLYIKKMEDQYDLIKRNIDSIIDKIVDDINKHNDSVKKLKSKVVDDNKNNYKFLLNDENEYENLLMTQNNIINTIKTLTILNEQQRNDLLKTDYNNKIKQILQGENSIESNLIAIRDTLNLKYQELSQSFMDYNEEENQYGKSYILEKTVELENEIINSDNYNYDVADESRCLLITNMCINLINKVQNSELHDIDKVQLQSDLNSYLERLRNVKNKLDTYVKISNNDSSLAKANYTSKISDEYGVKINELNNNVGDFTNYNDNDYNKYMSECNNLINELNNLYRIVYNDDTLSAIDQVNVCSLIKNQISLLYAIKSSLDNKRIQSQVDKTNEEREALTKSNKKRNDVELELTNLKNNIDSLYQKVTNSDYEYSSSDQNTYSSYSSSLSTIKNNINLDNVLNASDKNYLLNTVSNVNSSLNKLSTALSDAKKKKEESESSEE